MAKISEIRNKKTGQVVHKLTIPKDIIEDKGWSNKTNIIIKYDSNGDVIIAEKRKI